jgi:hypothetical protein
MIYGSFKRVDKGTSDYKRILVTVIGNPTGEHRAGQLK